MSLDDLNAALTEYEKALEAFEAIHCKLHVDETMPTIAELLQEKQARLRVAEAQRAISEAIDHDRGCVSESVTETAGMQIVPPITVNLSIEELELIEQACRALADRCQNDSGAASVDLSLDALVKSHRDALRIADRMKAYRNAARSNVRPLNQRETSLSSIEVTRRRPLVKDRRNAT